MNGISSKITPSSLRPKRVYDVLKQDVIKAIASGRLKTGERLKGVLPLSEEYGISKESACNAINELAAEGIVTKSRGRGIFVSQNVNGRKKRKVLENLDIVMVFGADPMKKYPSDQNRLGVIDALTFSGSRLHVHSYDYSLGHTENFRNLKTILLEQRFDGIIFRWHIPFLLRKIADQPIVFCNQHQPPSYYNRACQVNCSSIEIAYTATEMLLQNNHQNIGLIIPTPRLGFTDPSHGYIAALHDYSLEFRDCFILDNMNPFNGKDIHRKIIDFFKTNQDLTAVYVSDDYLCGLVLNALTVMGKKVPKDISVVSFANKGDIPAWPQEISRIEVDQHKFGIKCGETFMQLINGEIQPGTCVGFSPTLIEGETIKTI